MGALFRRINLRHLAGRPLRTSLTVAGIAAGVALFFSISVINQSLLSSFRSSMRDLAGAAELEVAASTPAGLPQSDVGPVARVNGVRAAVPVVRALARAHGPDGSRRLVLVGVTPGFASLFPSAEVLGPPARLEVEGGFGADGDGMLLARRVAAELGLAHGDRIAVETPGGRRQIRVSGLIGGGVLAAINGGDVGIMTLRTAQTVFDKAGRIDSIYVAVHPEASLDAVGAGIRAAVGASPVVGPPGERGRGLERVFEGLGTLLNLAGTVALFVAMFVVFNTMSMSLAERRREISMALSFGAERRQILGAFVLEAAVLGAAASALGVGAGLGLARVLLERADQGYEVLPVAANAGVVVDVSHILVAAFGGMAVALIGAVVPARRVLSVAPVESLRPEASYEWQPAHDGGGRARTAAAGVAALAVGVGFFVAFVTGAEDRWVPVAGLVSGLGGITLLLPAVVPPAVGLLRPILRCGFGTVGRLSSDALAKNPGRTTFTVAAFVLTLGVAIGVGSALASYQAQVERVGTSLTGAPLYVTAKSYSGLSSDQPLRASLRGELAAVSGVRYVYPIRGALLNVGREQGVMFAVPVRELLERGATTDLAAITDRPDRFIDGLEAGGIAVSRTTAARRGVGAGDRLSLPTPDGKRSFRVAAVFDDLLEFDSFYIDYQTYVALWGDRKVDQFGVLLDDGAGVSAVKERLLGTVRRSGATADVFTEEELVGRILEVVEGTFSLGRGIQAAALIVAFLTIVNTMFTAVFERRREMGLQRALGMSRSQVAGSVLLEAAGIGLIGGLGGAALGTLNGYLMVQAMEAQFVWRIAFVPPLALAGAAVAGSVAISSLAGLIPSRLAVRPPIVHWLRYE